MCCLIIVRSLFCSKPQKIQRNKIFRFATECQQPTINYELQKSSLDKLQASIFCLGNIYNDGPFVSYLLVWTHAPAEKMCFHRKSLRSPAIENHAGQHLSTAVTLEAFSINALLFGGVCFHLVTVAKKKIVVGGRC